MFLLFRICPRVLNRLIIKANPLNKLERVLLIHYTFELSLQGDMANLKKLLEWWNSWHLIQLPVTLLGR
jgi:hypothetical protein